MSGVLESEDGKLLIHCHSGCETEAVLQALGLNLHDLFPSSGQDKMDRGEDVPPSGPCTLRNLANAKKLLVPFLQSLGLKNAPCGVLIPYRDYEGATVTRKTRIRIGNGPGKFLWPTGQPLLPYGRERLKKARKEGALILVEGESDCWTLWHHGHPALGIPGASTAKALEAEDLEGISKLYVHQEPDKGGNAFVRGVARRLEELHWKGKAFVVRLDGTKDPSELHIQLDGDRGKFRATLDILHAPTGETFRRGLTVRGATDLCEYFQHVASSCLRG